MRIVVAGAGIGGLTVAALLQRDGHDVELVERAAALGEIGAGIQISPNAARVLDRLGLTAAFDRVATTPERIVMRRWQDSAVLLETPLAQQSRDRYGFAYANVYRPDLIDVLAGPVAAVPIHFGAVVSGASSTSDTAQLHLEDGTTIEADLVIGADGINSTVRASLLGEQPARFSGNVAYRALVPRGAVAHLPVEVTNHVGPHAHLVSYFVGEAQRLLNLVCVVEEPERVGESWTTPGSRHELRSHFATWSPLVQELLEHVTEPVFKWSLYDREPFGTWTGGRVALLGDACHPMLPYLAQGAAQAMEDAALLSTLLRGAGPGELTDALRRYEAVRQPRTSEIQARAYANRTTYHLPDGDAQERRDARLGQASRSDAAGSAFDWLYGHDPFVVP